MKHFKTLAEFIGQLKTGNKLAIVSHQILSNGKTDDTLYEGIVDEIADNYFTFEYNNGASQIKTTQWLQEEIHWCGSAKLYTTNKSFCSVYNSNSGFFGQSSSILFKSAAGCTTFAIHPDTPSCCPKCKGSGMSYTTVSEWGKKEKEISIGSCYDCKGLPVDEFEGRQIEDKNAAIDAMWCKCGHGDCYYVPDTRGMKHHYRCRKCRKITQIG